MGTNAAPLFINFIDPSKETRRVFRKRIRSQVAKNHHHKAARKKPDYLSSHETILTFSEPDTVARNRGRPKRSWLLKCGQGAQGHEDVSTRIGRSLINAMEHDFVQLRKKEFARAIGDLEATEQVCQCSRTKLETCDHCRSLSPVWLLADSTDELNLHCRRLGEGMSDVLVSYIQI